MSSHDIILWRSSIICYDFLGGGGGGGGVRGEEGIVMMTP